MTKANKDKPKMSIKVPGQSDREEAAKRFIEDVPGGSLEPKTQADTEHPAKEPSPDEILPWEEPGVREDVIKQYT